MLSVVQFFHYKEAPSGVEFGKFLISQKPGVKKARKAALSFVLGAAFSCLKKGLALHPDWAIFTFCRALRFLRAQFGQS